MPGQKQGGTPKHLHSSTETWEEMKRSRRWSESIILFSSYSCHCHMPIGTEVLEESALQSPLLGHSVSLQPPLPIRKGFRESLVSGRVPGHLCFAGKFDVAAITYCPCSYPV